MVLKLLKAKQLIKVFISKEDHKKERNSGGKIAL